MQKKFICTGCFLFIVLCLQMQTLKPSLQEQLSNLTNHLNDLTIVLEQNKKPANAPQAEQQTINKWLQDAENLKTGRNIAQAAEALLREIINKNETLDQTLFNAEAKQEDNISYALGLISFFQPQLNILTSYASLLIKKNTNNFGKGNYSSAVNLDVVKRNGEKKLKEWKQEQQRTKVAAGNPEEELSAAIQKRARRQSTGAIFTLPPQQPQEEAPEESELEKRLKKEEA